MNAVNLYYLSFILGFGAFRNQCGENVHNDYI